MPRKPNTCNDADQRSRAMGSGFSDGSQYCPRRVSRMRTIVSSEKTMSSEWP